MSIPDKTIERLTEALASSLKDRRLALGMSLTSLAEETGLSHTAVRNIEECQRTPTIASLFKITDALGMTCWEFIKDAEKQKKVAKKRSEILSEATQSALETLRIKCQKSPNLAKVVEGLVREV